MGKLSRGNSRQYSSRDMAAHTKLKFRQPGQGTTSEIERKDLRLELERAEKRQKTSDFSAADTASADSVEDEVSLRRKLLQEAADLDKDDSDSDGEVVAKPAAASGDTEAAAAVESEEESTDDDEDETAELLRELEKIKRERQEEKERLERDQASNDAQDRDASIAVGNPLLDLQAALAGNASPAPSSTSGFSVKRRWDDDVIFKNQATSEKPRKEFVNDLLRTEFHKRFLKRYVA